jgi:negative regulator of flagellin synthesis FlgM
MPIDPVMGNVLRYSRRPLGVLPLFGETPVSPAVLQMPKSGVAASAIALGSEWATLLSVGSEVSLIAAKADVRPDKVAAVQAALAAGTYHVPPAAVASRVVDYMLVL